MRSVLSLAAVLLAAGCPPPTVDPPDASDDFVEPGRADGGTAYAFCPTRIDVYGGTGAVFTGCGGEASPLTAAGLLSPGDAGYDATLAGRLRARLAADPALDAAFPGAAWAVRSCARAGGMASYVRYVPQSECGNAGNTGDHATVCEDAPAPLVLFSASNTPDRCHGGGEDSTLEDDEQGYAEHWSLRFEQFRQDRADAGFVLVSPMTEWHAQGVDSTRGSCSWKRVGWNASGGRRWRATHAAVETVRRVGELQAVFERHHPCCTERGVSCEASWFPDRPDAGQDGWTTFDCQGAAAVEEFWFAELKTFLLHNRFACP